MNTVSTDGVRGERQVAWVRKMVSHCLVGKVLEPKAKGEVILIETSGSTYVASAAVYMTHPCVVYASVPSNLSPNHHKWYSLTVDIHQNNLSGADWVLHPWQATELVIMSQKKYWEDRSCVTLLYKVIDNTMNLINRSRIKAPTKTSASTSTVGLTPRQSHYEDLFSNPIKSDRLDTVTKEAKKFIKQNCKFTASTFHQSFHASEHSIDIICVQEHKNTHDEFGGVFRTDSNISNEAFLRK